MTPVCYKKGREQGLWWEIQCLEKLIASPTIDEEEKKFAKKLLRSYKKYSEKEYNAKSALVKDER